jgi:hypothetical protein
MPHYADGTPAQVGDFAKGTPYNTPHEVVGTVVGIVPNTDACNLRIVFVKPHIGGNGMQNFYRYVHNYGDAPIDLEIAMDYGATKDFVKI